MTTPTTTATAVVAIALAVAACGGGSDSATNTPPAPDTAPAPASAAATSASGSSEAPTPPTDAPTATSGSGTAGGSAGCPADAEISAAYGVPVALDEANAMTGAIGLVFCPYLEVIAPGTTDQYGMEAFPDEFSLTFTDQNPVIVDEFSEDVPGLGEQAVWSGSELAVWTGERGLIVSMVFPPPNGDARATSIAIVELAT